MTSFDQMGLADPLMHRLQHLQFTQPTAIQAAAIPLALKGKDIIGSAQTGTGKTAAFGIPLVAKLLADPDAGALVITPTRELATQVATQLRALLSKKSNISCALLIGGEPLPRQLKQLRNNPRIIVGTPGRINDHLQRNNQLLSRSAFFVLDETDRMLDMGFTAQIEQIMRALPAKRQTLLFSATVPNHIIRIAQKYLSNPERVAVSPPSAPASGVQQSMLKTSDEAKYPLLVEQLSERQGSIIVFVKTKYATERMAKRLGKEGYRSCAIHGDLRQNKRNRVIADFRNQKYHILVATDVAARGLDIPHIAHVINYDLPQCPEDYIHRIGRTARAGAQGSALNLVTPSDKAKWHAIERLLNPNAHASKPAAPSSKRRFIPKGKKESLKHDKRRHKKQRNYAKAAA